MADTPRPARVTRETVEHIDLDELRSMLRQVVDSPPPEVLKQYLRLVEDLDGFEQLTEEQTLGPNRSEPRRWRRNRTWMVMLSVASANLRLLPGI